MLNFLGEISFGKYREMFYLDKRIGKIYINLNFWSKVLFMLKELYFKFYDGKVKIVFLDLLLLIFFVLVYWVM